MLTKLESPMDTSIGSDACRSSASPTLTGVESPSSSANISPTSDAGTSRLKFSIDNILQPTFGGNANKATEPAVNLSLNHQHGFPTFNSLCSPPTSLSIRAPPPPNIITSVVAAALQQHHQQQIQHHIQQQQQQQQQQKQVSPASSVASLASPTTPKSMLSPTTPSSLSAITPTTDGPPSAGSGSSGSANATATGKTKDATPAALWPAWVFCTRYSDRPSSGPRCRRIKRKATQSPTPAAAPAAAAVVVPTSNNDEKRPRTAFTGEQLNRLKHEFQENRYLTEKRRHELAHELGLNESQIKIWFQNKRAKIKKQTGHRNALAYHLMAQGLYNHSTVPIIDTEEDDDEMTKQ